MGFIQVTLYVFSGECILQQERMQGLTEELT
jgi:hypothetical protein